MYLPQFQSLDNGKQTCLNGFQEGRSTRRVELHKDDSLLRHSYSKPHCVCNAWHIPNLAKEKGGTVTCVSGIDVLVERKWTIQQFHFQFRQFILPTMFRCTIHIYKVEYSSSCPRNAVDLCKSNLLRHKSFI